MGLILLSLLIIALFVLVKSAKLRSDELASPDTANAPGQAISISRELLAVSASLPTSVPLPETGALRSLNRKDALAINAARPYSEEKIQPARPFRFQGRAEDRAKAVDCLAAAAWYEAGDDPVGQKSVVQVVLNRVAHPAFPNSICGVVFQGADRKSGCQFTFTCDGALKRRPSSAAWQRARSIGSAAISGEIYKPVGLATHYHTDWVVPIWSDQLVKMSKVRTHLFFRWPGSFGSPNIFRQAYARSEPAISRLGFISPDHSVASAVAMADMAAEGELAGDAEISQGSGPTDNVISHPQGGAYLVKLDPAAFPGSFATKALSLCREENFCKVMGWTDRSAMARGFPIKPNQRAAMSFYYLRDRGSKVEIILWNCRQFARSDRDQCLPTDQQEWEDITGLRMN